MKYWRHKICDFKQYIHHIYKHVNNSKAKTNRPRTRQQQWTCFGLFSEFSTCCICTFPTSFSFLTFMLSIYAYMIFFVSFSFTFLMLFPLILSPQSKCWPLKLQLSPTTSQSYLQHQPPGVFPQIQRQSHNHMPDSPITTSVLYSQSLISYTEQLKSSLFLAQVYFNSICYECAHCCLFTTPSDIFSSQQIHTITFTCGPLIH